MFTLNILFTMQGTDKVKRASWSFFNYFNHSFNQLLERLRQVLLRLVQLMKKYGLRFFFNSRMEVVLILGQHVSVDI